MMYDDLDQDAIAIALRTARIQNAEDLAKLLAFKRRALAISMQATLDWIWSAEQPLTYYDFRDWAEQMQRPAPSKNGLSTSVV